MQQRQGKDTDHTPSGGRPPEYVIVTWVSAQLRDRVQRNGASLAEALHAGEQQLPGPDADPQLEDREAEP